MQLIIIGQNRAETCKIKRGDYEKQFLRTRGQLYMIMPDALTRCIRTRNGRRIDDEEVLVFSENATRPYDTGKTACYDPSMILGTIDLEKILLPNSALGKARIFATQIRSVWKALAPVSGVVIAGIILLWAVLQ